MQVWSVNCIYSFKFNSNSLACIVIWTHNEEMECDNCEIAVPGFISRHYTVHTGDDDVLMKCVWQPPCCLQWAWCTWQNSCVHWCNLYTKNIGLCRLKLYMVHSVIWNSLLTFHIILDFLQCLVIISSVSFHSVQHTPLCFRSGDCNIDTVPKCAFGII